MIGCSSRIACSTRASVEKPVLPRRFFDSAELVEQHRAELLRRADDELLARQVQISRSRPWISSRTRVDLGQAVAVQAHAGDLHVAQHAHSGSSTSAIRHSRPRSCSCSRCHAGERLRDDGVARA
jgi:hypothetical protein